MINKNNSVPLYEQLINVLIKQIQEELAPDEKMLSERRICEKYDVSRTTVRLALAELENLGYIYKRPGKGSFVANVGQDKQNLMDYYSFTDQMQQLGKHPSSEILSFDISYVNEYIAEKLEIGPNELVYKIQRLRLADDVPMMLEYTYVPVEGFPGLTKERLEEQPLYTLFSETYDSPIKVADEEFSAGLMTKKEAEKLKMNEESICLKLNRVSYDKNNRAIEFTISTVRSDQFNYKVRHIR